MVRVFLTFFVFFPTFAQAAEFTRPIPQAQSATAEWWFFAASVALLVALWAVHQVVHRR